MVLTTDSVTVKIGCDTLEESLVVNGRSEEVVGASIEKTEKDDCKSYLFVWFT